VLPRIARFVVGCALFAAGLYYVAVVDFTADWCLACHELDRVTLRHPRVAGLLAGLERIRVDTTRMNEPVEELFARFHVLGLPAIVVVSPAGAAVEEARITSFVSPEEAVRLFRLAGLRPLQDEGRLAGLGPISNQGEQIP
jgi:thiol:disulfide interchange protein